MKAVEVLARDRHRRSGMPRSWEETGEDARNIFLSRAQPDVEALAAAGLLAPESYDTTPDAPRRRTAPGGVISGRAHGPVHIETWECVIDKDRLCNRGDDPHHDPHNAPPKQKATWWTCAKLKERQ